MRRFFTLLFTLVLACTIGACSFIFDELGRYPTVPQGTLPIIAEAPPSDTPFDAVLASQQLAVKCSETISPRDPDAYSALADLAYDRAGDVGPKWSWNDARCVAWPAVAADRYTGPWDVPTANPVLLINTTHDPATPLRSAAVMARTLARARLLTVAGYGHGLGGVPSTCVNEYMAGYFVDGTLPPEGTVCRQDVAPFTAGPAAASGGPPQ